MGQRMMDGCRGYTALRDPKDATVKHTMNCKLIHHSDPYTKLGPFKMEFASNRPLIVIFHEILTEEDIRHFLEFATPRLSRNRENPADASYSRNERQAGKVKEMNTLRTTSPF